MQAARPANVPHPGHAARPASATPLSPRQAATLAAWGVLLWFAVALFIRWAPPALFGRGVATALLFAAAAPIAWVSIWATQRVAALRPDQLVAGAALASAAAMFCDGIALTWSSLYGPGTDLVPAAAWLLWGVAAILTAAFVTAHRLVPDVWEDAPSPGLQPNRDGQPRRRFRTMQDPKLLRHLLRAPGQRPLCSRRLGRPVREARGY